MRAVFQLIVATALIALAGASHPDCARAQTDDAHYRELVRNALAEFDAKNWVEARELFGRAHAAQPSARTLRGLGMVAFEMQDYVEARRQLSAALRDPRKPLDGELRSQTEALLARTRQLIGRARIALDPPQATLRLDGKRIERAGNGELWMKAGAHVLIAEARGHQTQRIELDILGGEDVELELELEPALLAQAAAGAPGEHGREQALSESLASTPDGMRDQGDDALTEKWWFWAGAGALAIGIGTAVALLASGDGPAREAQKSTDGMIITTLSLP